MLEFAINIKKPVVIRYPRGGEDAKIKFEKHDKIELGTSETLQEGNDITIIAIGKMVAKAMHLANKIKSENTEENKRSVEVINTRFLKPFDTEKIKKSIEKTKNVITIEDGTCVGGLATTIKELIVDNNIQDVKIKTIAYPDKFIEHGTAEELEKMYGFDIIDILK